MPAMSNSGFCLAETWQIFSSETISWNDLLVSARNVYGILYKNSSFNIDLAKNFVHFLYKSSKRIQTVGSLLFGKVPSRTIPMIWINWISKYLNINFFNYPGRLRPIIIHKSTQQLYISGTGRLWLLQETIGFHNNGISTLVNISKDSQTYFYLLEQSISWNRTTIVVTLNNWISKKILPSDYFSWTIIIFRDALLDLLWSYHSAPGVCIYYTMVLTTRHRSNLILAVL